MTLNQAQFGDFEGETKDYEGRVGDRSHLTRVQRGTLPTRALVNMPGVKGEQPGAHTTRTQDRYEELREDIRQRGILEPIFITHDYGEEPKISEGNNRRDAAVETGMERVPVEIRHFGHAEKA